MLLIVTLFLVILGLTLLFFARRDQTWTLISGPLDPTATDFSTLRLSDRPNQYLVCPKGYCSQTDAQAIAPEANRSPAEFAEAIAQIFKQTSHMTIVREREFGSESASAPKKNLRPIYRLDAIIRSKLMRFPDLISLEVLVNVDSGQVTYAIFSRSVIGYSDLGVNEARVLAWMAQIGEIR